MIPLGLLFGALVGFALGLTGGGGSIFAVPLLVYGLSVSAHEAVGISLAAVGSTALFGAIQRMRMGQTEARTGVIFALFGMAGAPLGSWIGRRLPEAVLLLGFSALMLFIATRMWRTAQKKMRAPAQDDGGRAGTESACRRDASGRLHMTSRCALVMSTAGVGTGILSGLFGVGGGFIIVPALTFFFGMEMHRAVATSLLVIAMVSSSGVFSFVAANHHLDFALTGVFVAGGIGGLTAGTAVGRRISGPRLQMVFSIFILVVAVFVVVRTLAR
ncbi:MAG: sulfite exporter TauE/SafE family protein [Candidatus Eisenbacteria bacterium]|uniref:Probable membrane transporter protein n=1 Tax=Eiseniibacteriota bacterium TaxID=2212470 RepID=A0A956M0H0_UNCEI|nr:sulfite exporter TauE/SafE family protein [Candidatus Eisenbacteria bacterium]